MTRTSHRSPHTSLRRATIGFVGAGNMGQALIKGLVSAGVPARRLYIAEANADAARRVRAKYRVRQATLEQLVEGCDAIVLAVKPQDLASVVVELGGMLRRAKRRVLIISIAAGVKLEWLERSIGLAPVARVMPNLPAKVGAGMSVIASGRRISPKHRALAKAIFQCAGEVAELPERLFDVVTAVSGSGPAYFFLIFKVLRDAAMAEGVPKPTAERLALQTALGSVRLVEELGEELETLISQVASKGGTTEAALRVFADRGLADVIQAGVGAAVRRSRELARG